MELPADPHLHAGLRTLRQVEGETPPAVVRGDRTAGWRLAGHGRVTVTARTSRDEALLRISAHDAADWGAVWLEQSFDPPAPLTGLVGESIFP